MRFRPVDSVDIIPVDRERAQQHRQELAASLAVLHQRYRELRRLLHEAEDLLGRLSNVTIGQSHDEL